MFSKGKKSLVRCDIHADKLEIRLLFHAIKQVKRETDITTEMEIIGRLIGLLIGSEVNILPL